MIVLAPSLLLALALNISPCRRSCVARRHIVSVLRARPIAAARFVSRRVVSRCLIVLALSVSSEPRIVSRDACAQGTLRFFLRVKNATVGCTRGLIVLGLSARLSVLMIVLVSLPGIAVHWREHTLRSQLIAVHHGREGLHDTPFDR